MRNVLWTLVGLFVAFVLGVALFNFVIMPRFVQTNVEVVVPRLIGLEAEQAERLCQRRGLKMQVDDRRNSEGIPVAGPARIALTITAGSSAILERPVISVMSESPGQLVAVIERAPEKNQYGKNCEATERARGFVHRVRIANRSRREP